MQGSVDANFFSHNVKQCIYGSEVEGLGKYVAHSIWLRQIHGSPWQRALGWEILGDTHGNMCHVEYRGGYSNNGNDEI